MNKKSPPPKLEIELAEMDSSLKWNPMLSD